MGFGFSPLLDSQEPGLDILKRWTMIFNTALVWTGYSLFFSPYGAETVTANGVTYRPTQRSSSRSAMTTSSARTARIRSR
jgi:hypothetical protein